MTCGFFFYVQFINLVRKSFKYRWPSDLSTIFFFLRIWSAKRWYEMSRFCFHATFRNRTVKLCWFFDVERVHCFELIAGGGKASVMERVTNVFCGGGAVAYTNLQSPNNANSTPEKPSRSVQMPGNNAVNTGNNKSINNSAGNTTSRGRISRNRMKNVPLASGGTGGYFPPSSWEHLMSDDNFLSRFFLYFNANDRRVLAQVNKIFILFNNRSHNRWSSVGIASIFFQFKKI